MAVRDRLCSGGIIVRQYTIILLHIAVFDDLNACPILQ